MVPTDDIDVLTDLVTSLQALSDQAIQHKKRADVLEDSIRLHAASFHDEPLEEEWKLWATVGITPENYKLDGG